VGPAAAHRGRARLGPVAEWSAIGPFRLLTALPARLAAVSVTDLGAHWTVAVNLLVAVVVTLILRAMKTPDGVDGTQPDDYFADEGDPRLERERTRPDELSSST